MARKFGSTSNTPQGKLIHHASDDYGNILVLDYPHYRVMSFDSSYEQSGFCIEKPYSLVHEYTRIMLLALSFITPKHITLLGLGGGSLLRSLHFYLNDCQFLVVELRQKVIDIAKLFFDIPTDARVNFSVSDAMLHIKNSITCSSDIIFSDIYDAADMSSIQVQPQFITECERILTPKGWLVINFHTLPERHSHFFEQLRQQFPTIFICAGEYHSHVLFAGKAHQNLPLQTPHIINDLENNLAGEFSTLLTRLENIST